MTEWEGKKRPSAVRWMALALLLVLAVGAAGILIWRSSLHERFNDAVFVSAVKPERMIENG